MSDKDPEKLKYYQSAQRNIFWLEYDMFYVEVLKCLIHNYNLSKFSCLNIAGEFKKKGSKISGGDFEIIFRKKPKPSDSYQLTFKSEFLVENFKFDLMKIDEDLYTYSTYFGKYRIKISKNKSEIFLVESFKSDSINQIKSIDILRIIHDLGRFYLKNFDRITDRYLGDKLKTKTNSFFYNLLRIKGLDESLDFEIKKSIEDKSDIWGDLEQYLS